MKIDSVKLVTYSPTGNSRKVAEAITKGIQAPFEHLDLTPPSGKTRDVGEFHDELTIITSPVYVGRVPYEVAHRVRRLKANETPAVLVITYGNRAYEDALMELSDIVSEVGFRPVAACAFIGEHSWSMPETPLGHGRPDAEDLARAEAFGEEIREKYEGVDSVGGLSRVTVPGVNPYTLRASRYVARRLMSPFTDEELCSKCGKCAEVCPTGAVMIKKVVSNLSPRVGLNTRVVSTDEVDCTWCAACVRNCPTGARVRRPLMLEHSDRLSKAYGEWKEPETFI